MIDKYDLIIDKISKLTDIDCDNLLSKFSIEWKHEIRRYKIIVYNSYLTAIHLNNALQSVFDIFKLHNLEEFNLRLNELLLKIEYNNIDSCDLIMDCQG
jgi:hypothetical protein